MRWAMARKWSRLYVPSSFRSLRRTLRANRAQRYHGVIPADRWHEPSEMVASVEFWGADLGAELGGRHGNPAVLDVELIRHAYVLPAFQGKGIGSLLLTQLSA
jgi:GNAT superfamily N-acetyltransferase